MIVTFLSWLNVCVCINKRSVKACNVVYWARWSRWCLFMIKFHVVSLCELFLKRQHYACPWHAAYTLLLQPQTVYYRHVIYRLGTVGPLFTAQLLCRSQSRHTRFQMSLASTDHNGATTDHKFSFVVHNWVELTTTSLNRPQRSHSWPQRGPNRPQRASTDHNSWKEWNLRPLFMNSPKTPLKRDDQNPRRQ